MSLNEIRAELRELEDPVKAQVLQRFFKTGPGEYGEGDIFLGIKVPALRKIAKKYREVELPEIDRLLQSSVHEERFLALVLAVQKYQKGSGPENKEIYEFYLSRTAYINSWDLVDTSAPHIVGTFLLDKSKKPLYRLAKSRNLWERRVAIVATFHFIRQESFDDTLRISEMLLSDREDLIHKAVGWMLREIGNRDRAMEEAFLRSHYKKMPRVMLRYAIEKFPESRRKRYLRGDI